MPTKTEEMNRRQELGWECGYDDGLQEGEQRGWEAGKEAAAELADAKARQTRSLCFQLSGETVGKLIAVAIRKLKKP